MSAEKLAKYGYKNMHEFRNWRWFKKYAGGPMSDLGAHQIDVYNWFLGANVQARPTTRFIVPYLTAVGERLAAAGMGVGLFVVREIVELLHVVSRMLLKERVNRGEYLPGSTGTSPSGVEQSAAQRQPGQQRETSTGLRGRDGRRAIRLRAKHATPPGRERPLASRDRPGS